MRKLSGITLALADRKPIVVLLASMLALVLVAYSAPVEAGQAAPSAPSAPQATCPADGQCFADVPPGSPFYDYANNLYRQDIISGYACGEPGEPCDGENRPYYRPASGVTRAQMTKFVDLARKQPGIHIDTASDPEPLFSRTTAASGVGVTGVATGTNGIGVVGLGSTGVEATSSSAFGAGMRATSDGPFSNAVDARSNGDFGYGVFAVATGPFGTGVYGAGTGAFSFAGYFSGTTRVQGNMQVTGTCCAAAAGTYKIDHPQDPANKYLTQSAVESPDMKTIYDGVAVLDAKGEAVVVLPAYFEALNRDFRYQLTTIGGFAQVYIAEKVKGNRFKIAGGKAGMEVSWQVTGIRHDPYSEQHRTPVEEDKPQEERGLYLHPELYGQPESKQIGKVAPPSLPGNGEESSPQP